MPITTDPNDPRLKKQTDEGLNEVYLALPEEERAKGFVRPYRDTYIHVGIKPKYPLRDLTPDEQVLHEGQGYVKYETYPESESPKVGRFWTQQQLNSRCGTQTIMAQPLAETYARSPSFYGATYCAHCGRHFPVEEFVWLDGSEVGS